MTTRFQILGLLGVALVVFTETASANSLILVCEATVTKEQNQYVIGGESTTKTRTEQAYIAFALDPDRKNTSMQYQLPAAPAGTVHPPSNLWNEYSFSQQQFSGGISYWDELPHSPRDQDYLEVSGITFTFAFNNSSNYFSIDGQLEWQANEMVSYLVFYKGDGACRIQ